MKAQSAIEFLTTYGWALMAVLVIVGAIAILVTKNNSIFERQSCDLGAQLICQDYEITQEELHLILQNGYGETITIGQIQGMTFTNDIDSLSCPASFPPINAKAKIEVICSISGSAILEKGSSARIGLVVPIQRYSGGPQHNITGHVRARIN